MAERAAILLALCLAMPARAGTQPSPTGQWLTEDRGGVIQLQSCGALLCGIIVGLTDWPANGDVKRDWRGRPQCHSTLLAGLALQTDGRWHGTVTNPENGRVYSAEVWVPDGTLRLRGYVGLPMFGSTQLWPRFHGHVQDDCHFNPPDPPGRSSTMIPCTSGMAPNQ